MDLWRLTGVSQLRAHCITVTAAIAVLWIKRGTVECAGRSEGLAASGAPPCNLTWRNDQEIGVELG